MEPAAQGRRLQRLAGRILTVSSERPLPTGLTVSRPGDGRSLVVGALLLRKHRLRRLPGTESSARPGLARGGPPGAAAPVTGARERTP